MPAEPTFPALALALFKFRWANRVMCQQRGSIGSSRHPHNEETYTRGSTKSHKSVCESLCQRNDRTPLRHFSCSFHQGRKNHQERFHNMNPNNGKNHKSNQPSTGFGSQRTTPFFVFGQTPASSTSSSTNPFDPNPNPTGERTAPFFVFGQARASSTTSSSTNPFGYTAAPSSGPPAGTNPFGYTAAPSGGSSAGTNPFGHTAPPSDGTNPFIHPAPSDPRPFAGQTAPPSSAGRTNPFGRTTSLPQSQQQQQQELPPFFHFFPTPIPHSTADILNLVGIAMNLNVEAMNLNVENSHLLTELCSKLDEQQLASRRPGGTDGKYVFVVRD